MEIALTKKLADALGVKPKPADETLNPLFTWTASWAKVWDNRRVDDMLVLVNNATRLMVAIYEIKRKNLKDVETIFKNAIVNTLLAMNYNKELIDEYMRLAGEFKYARNSSPQNASWVGNAGRICSYVVARKFNGVEKVFCDTVGVPVNYESVNYSKGDKFSYKPYEMMGKELTKLTGLPTYKSPAFELLVSLDLELYKAERRILVPADMKFSVLHEIIQRLFDWNSYHLYDFTVLDGREEVVACLVPSEEDLEYDEEAELMDKYTLDDFFPKYKNMVYTYDMGDYWEHEIKLVKAIKEYSGELPYLLEAHGQAPPEDVGGVWGFLEFREIIMDPAHPEYEDRKEWAGYWSLDYPEWKSKPRVIRL